MVRFYADRGEMTVLRSLAAFAYGTWAVQWPDVVPEDQRPSLPDDREFGFAARLKDTPGRMGRRFIRRDVSITAAGGDDPGSSDVERVLDDAASRTDSEVIFEKEFTRENLGGLVPFVDFGVGDAVEVVMWSRVVSSFVSSVESVTEAGAVVDWRVRLGGSLLGDARARDDVTADLEAQIAKERRERLKDVGAVDAKATAAGTAARTAQGAADAARVVADRAETKIDSYKTEANRKMGQLVSTADFTTYDGELTKKLWQMQQEVDAAQDEAAAATRKVAEENAARLVEHRKLIAAQERATKEQQAYLYTLQLYGEYARPKQIGIRTTSSQSTWQKTESIHVAMTGGDFVVNFTDTAYIHSVEVSGWVYVKALVPYIWPVSVTVGTHNPTVRLGTPAFENAETVVLMCTPTVDISRIHQNARAQHGL